MGSKTDPDLGVTHRQRFEELLQYKITPAMFRLKEAKELSCLAKERGLTAKIHLALDTGMSRIGMAPSRMLQRRQRDGVPSGH